MKLLLPKTLLVQKAASDHGEKYDEMFRWTVVICGIVFLITQILLFVFAYRYQYNEKRKVYFFPHNNTMELVWTVVPAIALTVLIVIGLRNWFAMTSEAPKNALQVEITGKQFGWLYRYPGKDGQFGEKYYKMIDEANSNPLGQLFKDSAALNVHADPKNFDDVTPTTMYVVKGRPVKANYQFARCNTRCRLTAFQNENGCGTRNAHYHVVYTFVYDKGNEGNDQQS